MVISCIVDKNGLTLNFYDDQVSGLLASLSEISALKKYSHEQMEFDEADDIGCGKKVIIGKAEFSNAVNHLQNELSECWTLIGRHKYCQ